MTRFRKLIYAAAFAFAGATSFVGLTSYGQEIGQGMVRSGTVGIENDIERKLFWSLICTCGCPRETLGTCTCGWAHDRREELRAMLKSGMSVEQAQAEYSKRFEYSACACSTLMPLLSIARSSSRRSCAQPHVQVPSVSRGQPHVQIRLQNSFRSMSFSMPTVPDRTIPWPISWP